MHTHIYIPLKGGVGFDAAKRPAVGKENQQSFLPPDKQNGLSIVISISLYTKGEIKSRTNSSYGSILGQGKGWSEKICKEEFWQMWNWEDSPYSYINEIAAASIIFLEPVNLPFGLDTEILACNFGDDLCTATDDRMIMYSSDCCTILEAIGFQMLGDTISLTLLNASRVLSKAVVNNALSIHHSESTTLISFLHHSCKMSLSATTILHKARKENTNTDGCFSKCI